MANVTTKTQSDLVQAQAAAIQSRASGLLDFSQGSILRAVIQAVSGVALWLQAVALAILAMTRLSTSQGADVDSFIADFFGPIVDGGEARMARFGAAPSKGTVTFSRLTPSGDAYIPLGAGVETADNRQRFVVTLNAALTSWRPDVGENGSYVMLDTVGSLSLPVEAITPGAASNVQEGAISVITSSIVGVDLVTNPAPFVDGVNSETDEALKIRFRSEVRALREATPAAIEGYIEGIGAGIAASTVEFEDLDGTPRAAFFYEVVDDGTGFPSAAVLATASQLVREHRAAGVQAAVVAPTVIAVAVVFTLDLADTGHEAQDIAAAQAAATAFVNGHALGEDLTFNRLFGAIYGAADTILEVVTLTVNGATVDIITAKNQVVKTSSVTGSQA